MPSRKLQILQANLRKIPAVQYSLLNDEEIRHHGILLIQEPYCFPNQENEVVAPPARQGQWEQFLPTEQREGRWPIRSLIYANNWTKPRQIPMASPDITAIEATLGDRQIMAVSIYVPCAHGDVAEAERTLQGMLDQIAAAKQERPNHELIVGGDFNRHDPLWGGDGVQHGEGNDILNFMRHLSLQIANARGVATHESGTTIDLTLLSSTLWEELEEWTIWPTHYGSDHEALHMVLTIEGYDQGKEPRKLFRNTKWDKTAKDVDREKGRRLTPMIPNPSIAQFEEYTGEFIEFTTENVTHNTPLSKPCPYAKQWWTRDLTELRNAYTRARNAAVAMLRAGCPNRRLEQERRETKKLYHDTYRRQRRTNWKEFLDVTTNIWKAAKYLHPATSSNFGRIAALKKDPQDTSSRPEEVTTCEEIGSRLLHQFYNQKANAPPPPEVTYPERLEWNEITKEEVHAAVKRLSPYKAPGPDGLPNVVWQKLWHVLGDELHYIVKTSIDLSYLPSQWKTANILPLRKPGKGRKVFNEPSSYRPISLLATISKIVESVLAERLSYLDEKFGLLPKAHYGGRKQRSTEDALTYLTEKIHWAWKRKMVVSLVAFDIKGAFNGVNLEILLHRMRMRRVPEPIVRWVQCFCSNRRASIKINGEETGVQDIEHAGLPQGSPLSPILFLFFNADLVTSKGTDAEDSIAFIDDYTVWTVGASAEANTKTIEEKILPRVETWARDSGATFEPTKTEFIHFTRRSMIIEDLPKLRIMSEERPPVQEVKVLGVILDSELRFKAHAARAAKRGERAALALCRLKGIRPTTARQLATATVLPIIDYGSTTWSPGATQLITHKLQRTMKIVAVATVAMFRSASVDVALAEASFRTTLDRLNERARRYWVKLHSKPKKHRIWKLLNRLHRYKTFQSPLERMAIKYDTIPTKWIQTVQAFTKAPWEPSAEILIQSKEEAINTSAQPGCPEVYTDASSRNGCTSIGVHWPGHRKFDTGLAIGTPPTADAFHGELEAIKRATEIIRERVARPAVKPVTIRIVSDCKRALQAIGNPTYQRRQAIQEIYTAIETLRRKNIHLSFRWTPAHAGVRGNELADELAAEQTSPSPYPGPKGPIAHQPLLQKDTVQWQHVRATFQNKPYGKWIKTLDRALPGRHTRKLYDSLTSTQAAVLAQMRSGYCRLNGYLHKIQAVDSGLCQCGAPETVSHFLLECSRWEGAREKLKEDIGPRAGEVSYLLGGYQNEAKDGEISKWTPNLQAVKRTIEFIQETGRLEEH
jgi:ribonuclease HI/exonuclease III